MLLACDTGQALLDDHIVKTLSMRASPFVKPLEARVLAWETLLTAAQELVDSWLACQVSSWPCGSCARHRAAGCASCM